MKFLKTQRLKKKMKDKLLQIQTKLKAPKNQDNKFGGYKYRSLEDIQEALKPLLAEQKCVLTISDTIEMIGNRFYIKATATLHDCESDAVISTTAFAREAEIKKGMDESQITGSTSSYARKYALNALFAIDDTKDADHTNTHGKEEPKQQPKKQTLGGKWEAQGKELGELAKKEIISQESVNNYRKAYSEGDKVKCDKIYQEIMESVNG